MASKAESRKKRRKNLEKAKIFNFCVASTKEVRSVFETI
jgi:hypothetical protein